MNKTKEVNLLEKEEVDLLAEMFADYIHLKLQELEELANPFGRGGKNIHFIDKSRLILARLDLGMRLIEKIIEGLWENDNSNPEQKGRNG